MKPLRFVCRCLTDGTPEQIGATILDTANWNSFRGWGPLPGIARAERTDGPALGEGDATGTRFEVTNTDGSGHAEQIVEWDLPRTIRLRMDEFPPSLARLATEYVETFRFSPRDGRTLIEREFELHPRHALTRPVLRPVGWMLRKAVDRHNRDRGADVL